MKIEFEKDYLKELYQDGKTKNKKYHFQKGVIKKYKDTIDKLKVANKTEDLYPIKSLNYEKLKGDKKGLESVRVDKKYRLEFRSLIDNQDSDCITVCSIMELSNHYN